MSNLPTCSSNHIADGDSHDDDDDDDGDYDIPLQNLKMRKPPNKTEKGIVMMNGLRCILYGELINGPFILFPSAQNSHINMICVYNEYFVENKMHHINLLDLNCILIDKEKSIIMVLMSTDVYEKVLNQKGDISESLNAGTSHVLEFLIDNEHERETMVADMKSLSINICSICRYSDSSDESLKNSLYERLCPEVFLIWKEVHAKDFSDATININLVSRMHVYLRDKMHSTCDEIMLFFYPIRGNIRLKSKKVLMGMNHIQSNQDIIAFDENSHTKGIEGEILRRLMQDASLDDRLIYFWFQWCENQLYDNKNPRKKIKFIDSLITMGDRNYLKLSDRNYDIFQEDIIIMPIHFDHHWSLAVIENPELLLIADGLAGAHTKIYHYDSLTHKGYGHSKSVVSEVVNEFLEKAVSTVGSIVHTLPMLEDGDAFGTQDGTLDCGLFVCKFIEHIFMKTVSDSIGFKRITQKDCTEFREEMITLLARLSCHHSQVREKYC